MRLIICLLLSATAHGMLTLIPSGRLGGTDEGNLSRFVNQGGTQRTLNATLRSADSSARRNKPLDRDRGSQAEVLPKKVSEPKNEAAPKADRQSSADASSSGWGIPAPHYVSPSELSERPRPPEDLNLEPPEIEKMDGAGKLMISLFISAEGAVDRIEIEKSTVPEHMQKVVLLQFSGARFKPGEKAGVAVPSRMRIEVTIAPRAPVVAAPPPRQR